MSLCGWTHTIGNEDNVGEGVSKNELQKAANEQQWAADEEVVTTWV